jgi:hypothetical protein
MRWGEKTMARAACRGDLAWRGGDAVMAGGMELAASWEEVKEFGDGRGGN